MSFSNELFKNKISIKISHGFSKYSDQLYDHVGIVTKEPFIQKFTKISYIRIMEKRNCTIFFTN